MTSWNLEGSPWGKEMRHLKKILISYIYLKNKLFSLRKKKKNGGKERDSKEICCVGREKH